MRRVSLDHNCKVGIFDKVQDLPRTYCGNVYVSDPSGADPGNFHDVSALLSFHNVHGPRLPNGPYYGR